MAQNKRQSSVIFFKYICCTPLNITSFQSMSSSMSSICLSKKKKQKKNILIDSSFPFKVLAVNFKNKMIYLILSVTIHSNSLSEMFSY